MNILKPNEVLKIIAKKSRNNIEPNLSQNILGILAEGHKKIGIYKQITVKDLTDQLFEEENFGFKYKGYSTEYNEKDLFVRTELYKLKNKDYIEFIKYKKNNYTIKLTDKGLNYCIALIKNFYLPLKVEVNDF
jgi:hypothetical protein